MSYTLVERVGTGVIESTDRFMAKQRGSSGIEALLERVSVVEVPRPYYNTLFFFFNKNLFYKNVEAGIGQNFKNMPRTYPG